MAAPCPIPSIERSQTPVERELTARTATLAQVLATTHKEVARDAMLQLLGLGPGLTPSGDDIVMGAVAMLVWRAQLGDFPVATLDMIAESVRMEAPRRTNLISARLLYFACEGVLYAPAMDLGVALLAGDAQGAAGAARRLLAIGSSSGADMAAGLLAALAGE